MMADLRTVNLV